jgi:hypothetical protein
MRGRYPKIGLPVEKAILKKLFAIKTRLKKLMIDDGKEIYYRTSGGRYYNVISNYPTGSTKEKSILLDKNLADSIGAILSSDFFYWYQQVYTNNLDLKSYEIEEFPIPVGKLTKEIKQKIENLYSQYLEDIERNVINHGTTNYATIDNYKEYKISKSKHLIDAMDDIICPLYGLNPEEVSFIKNYEIEFRMSPDDTELKEQEDPDEEN